MARKTQDLENQIREIRKQLAEQVSYLDFRTENKLSLLAELKDFYKKRGEVEFEYAKNLERLCDRFERNTKQRNIKYEVRSTFNLWSTLLAETRRIARDKATLAEVLSLEIGARLEIMSRDVLYLARKCKEVCTEVQENLMKELKELNEQSKHYQYACHHSSEAHSKFVKSHEKVESLKNSAAIRRKKAEEKEQERLKQYNDQKHRLLKTRNDYLLRLTSSNARLLHFYSVDIMDIIEFMDHDYHESYKRLVQAYSDAEQGSCNQVAKATGNLVNQSKTLDFENDLHYFMSEFSGVFTQPPEFHFQSFGEDDVVEYKVNVKDVFLRAQEMVKNLTVEVKTLRIQTEEDSKTIGHMSTKNLKKYKVQTVDDALGVLEEAGEPIPPEPVASKASSLDRGSLATTTRGVQALHYSQKGKEDTFSFTLGVFSRKLARAAQLNVSNAKLEVLEKSLSEQKVPPISVGGDFRLPKLFGGDCLEYIMATGLNIPLVLSSCCDAILKEGVTTEGLFRVPGPAQQIDDLKKSFEEGRDPLAYSVMKNIEITAVASVLKLYFRELANPLFPCEKYYDFIKCTRREDQQDRLDSIRDAVNSLHPAICGVMRYLFRFLYNVSEHHSETKMNTANLALVFGPTLTRAPPDADTRLLHNDVPSINVLIQLCIEHYEYIFGEDCEEEEEGRLASPPPPPPPLETSLLGTSLDDEANFGYRRGESPPLVNNEEQDDVGRVIEDEEVCELPEVPIINEEPPTPIDETPPARPPPPVIDTPEPVEEPHPQETHPINEEEPHPIAEPHPVEEPHPIEEPLPIKEPHPVEEQQSIDESQEQPVVEETVEIEDHTHIASEAIEQPSENATTEPVVAKQPEATPTTEAQEVTSGLSSQISTTSVNTFLDQALADIETSIEEMKERPNSRSNNTNSAVIPTATPVKDEGEDDEDENETDESDTEEEVMTITAKALYDYTARTEKELSFSKGDILEVVDKTKDGNWWDGFHGGRRGYVPVKYVEITELHSTPIPPQRKSSMNKEHLAGNEENDSQQSIGTSLATVQENVTRNDEATPTTTQEVKPEVVATTTTEEAPPTKSSDPSPKNSPEESPKRRKPVVPVKTGAVSKLTQQFQQPPPTQPPPTQRVLVGPHKTHNRYPSADMNKGAGQEGATPPRSNSSGSKPAPKPPAAPPTKPKPDKETPPTSSPFPLMSHDARVSASPLQRAHLEGTKTQATPIKKGGVFRSSAKRTGGAGGGGDKPPLPSKPQPPAKTTGSVQLQAELSSVVTARRRKPEDDAS